MRITQGHVLLPARTSTDEQIEAQLRYALANGWSIMVEYTDDPHPRNGLWEHVGAADVRPRRGRGRRRDARRARLPRGASAPLREGRRVRPLARAPDDGAVVHRQPPGARARASGSSARRPTTARSATRCTPTRPNTPRASATAARRRSRRSRRARASRTASRRRWPRRSNPAETSRPRRRRAVEAVLAELDRELVGLGPVKERIREMAALLVIDRLRARGRARVVAPVAAHDVHRQPRYRQDDGRAARWRRSSTARLHRQAEGGLGHARRPRRPVRRPHRAQDADVLKRAKGGVLFIDEAYYLLSARERARLRPGGDRDPAAGHGDRARRARRRSSPATRTGWRRSSARTPAWARASPTTSHFPDFTLDELVADRRADARAAAVRVRADEAARGVRRVHRAARRAAALRLRAQHPQRDRPRAHAPGRPAVRRPRERSARRTS